MDKIIKITQGIMIIGKDDGSIIEVPKSSFTGKIIKEGMFVNIYNTPDGQVIVAPFDNAISGEHVVNKLSYILLTLFLGGFGIHKFYSKHYIAGIFYLLFFWTFIPGLIALVEFIIACCKSADSQGNIEV